FNYSDSATADEHRVTSSNLTIDRTHLNPSLTGGNAVRNTPTSLEINKANDVGQALEGAEFEITAQGDSAFARPSEFAAGTYDEATKTVTLTTDSTGHIELVRQLMVGGTYTIYESGAPSGYDPADGVLTVVVQEDGSLEVQGDMPGRYAWADLNEDGHADNAYSFMVTNIHEEIDILKVDDEGDALEGAEFTLTGPCMDKNTSHTYTTDENGYIHVDAGLMGGVRYELRETKPADGYAQLEESLYFMMDERGEIVVTDAQQNPLDEEEYPEGYAVNDNRISLTVEDEPVELQITKRAPAGEDGEPGETLPWAEFSITPVNDSMFAAGADPTAPQTMRTGEDGTLSMTAWLIVGNEYDITEVKAPEGYERVTGTMRIRVGEDGSISVVGSVNEDGSITPAPPTGYTKVDNNAFEVAVVNEPIEIGIKKVGSNDTATGLAGAEFEITGVFAGSNEVDTRTFATGEDGRVEIEAELKSDEQYTLRETVAPAGYELLEGELTVKVAENGTLEVVDDVPDGYTLADGDVTIFAVDE
ncbi:SpaA isopeptide-forming pilin-related protein, partial [uncultured Enorma sp.]|uniref:MSCRAMM family protein n=1 Tax=uncultured Enorma sp. TaxID=1714346 RepID=UPI0028038DA5